MRLFLVLVFAFSAASCVHAQQGRDGNRKPRPSTAQQRGSDSLPVSVKLLNTGKSADDARQETERIDENRRQYRQTFLLTVVVAAVGVIQVVAMWLTYWLMRRTAQRQLRAYIGIDGMDYLPQGDGRALSYEIKLRNYGLTPAYGVSATTTRDILKYPLSATYKLIEAPDADQAVGAPPSYMTMHPGELRTVTSSVRDPRFSDEAITGFQDSTDGSPDQTQLYCFGTITYRDAFGRDHWARYCKSFGGDYYKRYKKGSTCHLYNESSDDPKKPKAVAH
jgi:hypothetical protein